MLGEQIGEEMGQITGMRVLPDDGAGAKVEVSFQQSGTLLGAHVTDMGTYIVSWQVFAADTHPSRGVFAFAIGRPSSKPPLR